jgi:hypothetical protein
MRTVIIGTWSPNEELSSIRWKFLSLESPRAFSVRMIVNDDGSITFASSVLNRNNNR